MSFGAAGLLWDDEVAWWGSVKEKSFGRVAVV